MSPTGLEAALSVNGNPLALEEAMEGAADYTYGKGDWVEDYAHRNLRPVEVILLVKYREAFAGRVLEIGCGAGRLTGYLIAVGGTVEAFDISPRMIDYCRRTYPGATFREGDLHDFSAYASDTYQVIFAPFNILGVLGPERRASVLGELSRMLAPDGLLMMSSHNRAYKPNYTSPVHTSRRDPFVLASRVPRVPGRIRNRRFLRRYERELPDYAIVNDEAHDYGLLHYYVSRDAQASRLSEQGLELVECLDISGNTVGTGESCPDCPELHYIARKTG